MRLWNDDLSHATVGVTLIWAILATGCHDVRADEFAANLPAGVRAIWNHDKAQRESTATRERICINGLCSGRVRR